MLTRLRREMSRVVLLATVLGASAACQSTSQASFATPEAAMLELADTVGTQDRARTERLFGEDGVEMLESGDEVADREDGLRVQEYIREKLAFEEPDADTRIALLGNDAWPFPIPLVREGEAWTFDVEAGSEEIANRRVGRNELSTIASMHEYVDAQREYAAEERDGQPRAYARTIISSTEKHDGLYWPTAPGEPESPLGSLIAAAVTEGYTPGADEPMPFHGYYFRVLTSQGSHAPGGAKSYVDARGRMTGGFALLAWPAKYGNSGVMSFQVNQQGIVYERDLGPETDAAIARITAFDPDADWYPASD